jgi:hypothetical protein
MKKLMEEEGQYECDDDCEDLCYYNYKDTNLFLLMYSEGVDHYVTIKDTTFSTHKVFNETYARLRVYNESLEDCDITF